MGCCCSKYYDDDNEQQDGSTPLLPKTPLCTFTAGPKKSPEGSYYTKQQEEKVWQCIIDRTSKLMIDNNLYPSMNPLSPQEIKERQQKYTEILQKVKIPPSTTITNNLEQQNIEDVVKILNEARPFHLRDLFEKEDENEEEEEIFEKINNARNQINKSLGGQGDLVVPMKKVLISTSTSSNRSNRRYS